MTSLRGNVDLQGLPDRCNHPLQLFRVPGTRQDFRARHPPLVGKVEAVLVSEWKPKHNAVFKSRMTEFPTTAAKSYPSGLNERLARRLIHGALGMRQKLCRKRGEGIPHSASQVCPGTGQVEQTAVRFANRLKGRVDPADKEAANQQAIGGLRHPMVSVRKIPKMVEASEAIRSFWDDLLDRRPEIQQHALSLFGQTDAVFCPDMARSCRTDFGAFLGCIQTECLEVDIHDCTIAAHLLEAWRVHVRDPETEVYKWYLEGTPGGLLIHPEDCGIFSLPGENEDDLEDINNLEHAGEEFSSYEGVEDDDEAFAEVNRLADEPLHYLKKFNTYQEVVEHL